MNDQHTSAAVEGAIAVAEESNEPKIGSKDKLEELCVNTIRFLAIDGVEKAKSGHPGSPMGMADMAFGTDTAGSIRVPAACCGVVGLKTTYGLIPIEGVYPVEPKHLDTVGPMGKDIDHTVQGMDLLQDGFAAKYAAAKAAKPTAQSIRVGRLKLKSTDPKIDQAIDDALAKAEFQVVELDESLSDKFEQAKKDGSTVAFSGAWISDERFQFALGVTARTQSVLRLGRLGHAVDGGNRGRYAQGRACGGRP